MYDGFLAYVFSKDRYPSNRVVCFPKLNEYLRKRVKAEFVLPTYEL